MANELTRHGVRCRIIDRSPQRSSESRALAIFPRTLEVFEMMGAAESFLAEGQRIRGLSFRHRDEEIAHVDLTSVASPYPFVLVLPQSETERLLNERLAAAGVGVERNLELTGLSQTSTGVQVVLRSGEGREETLETSWLVGCDGAHSTTRHLLGMGFEGTQYDESFILADVQLETTLTRDRGHLFLGDEGVFGVIPFAQDRWRIVANIPPESRAQALPELTLADVQTLIERRASQISQASNPGWLSRFHISHRKVPQFRQLRVFLAGDAAHIHSPAGGQGMNTGIQDAFNLGWKLALVVKGISPPQLLGSYHSERNPIASGVLNFTDRITRMATMRSSVAQGLRDFLLPLVSGIDFVEEKIADRLSELSVSYRESEIVENYAPGRVRAGDRAPDAELRDATNQARRLFELFRVPRYVLLVFLGATDAAEKQMDELAALLKKAPANVIDTYRIARGLTDAAAELRDVSGLAHAAYGLPAGGMVIVRPDGYIGYRSNDFDPLKLKTYFGRLFVPAPASVSPSC